MIRILDNMSIPELESVIAELEEEEFDAEWKYEFNRQEIISIKQLIEEKRENPCYGCRHINPKTNLPNLEQCKQCGASLTEVSNEEALNIIESRKPLGLFYTIEKGSYIGIDNHTGEAWTEDFENKTQCFKFLYGEEKVWQGDYLLG